jgi:hypothetical protein
MVIDYAHPAPADTVYTWSYSFWVRSPLTDIDTVEVRCSLSGTFWSADSTVPRFLGTFEWKNETRTAVHR